MDPSKLIVRPYIIADIGSNWCSFDSAEQNLNYAIKHIEEAARCQVDAVKFQYYTHKCLYGFDGKMPAELPVEWLPALAQCAADNEVAFMCTPFSQEGVRRVDPFVHMHKLASAENMHLGIIAEMVATKKTIIVSMGATTSYEFKRMAEKVYLPSSQFLFLECVASYPAEEEDYNLPALEELGWHGISDHTIGSNVALQACAVGAFIFEKHFRLHDASEKCPDYRHSATPFLMGEYVRAIRQARGMRAYSEKVIRQSELPMVEKYNRRLKCVKAIKKGQELKYNENYGIYRSKETDFKAASPWDWASFDGKIAKRDIQVGEGIHTELV